MKSGIFHPLQRPEPRRTHWFHQLVVFQAQRIITTPPPPVKANSGTCSLGFVSLPLSPVSKTFFIILIYLKQNFIRTLSFSLSVFPRIKCFLVDR